jgi:hypothetical protein
MAWVITNDRVSEKATNTNMKQLANSNETHWMFFGNTGYQRDVAQSCLP